mmetsp:Transcript_11661/g.35383  ORF Transcript_11661/g.35383 Transcript_11661/m.35383 type:complete len:242 (-) Transcript_11661:154-879(-)
MKIPVSDAKMDLLDILASGGVTAGDTFNRPEILEVLLKLEPQNPTEEPAYSDKLVGSWELRYDAGFQAGLVDSPTRELALFVYAGGYAPSLLLDILKKLPGPLQNVLGVDAVKIDIGDDLGVTATTSLNLVQGRKEDLTFKSRLLAETPARLSESFNAVEVLGREIKLPGPLAFMRRFIVSYVDDDLLIIRDEQGKPEILTKAPMDTFPMDEPVEEESEEAEPEEPLAAEDIQDDSSPSDA